MDDFPANSKQARETEPREKIKPVTSAETVRRKRGLGHKFKETFFSGSGRDALSYMVEEVVIPAIRETFSEAMHSGLDRIVYGDSRRPRRNASMNTTNAGHVDYAGISKASTRGTSQRMLSRSSRARHEFDDLIIPSAQEANEVIDQMFDVLSRYGQVSVADLYELTGIQSAHTDMKWGWTNLRGAKAIRLRQGGYLLDLPDPEALGR